MSNIKKHVKKFLKEIGKHYVPVPKWKDLNKYQKKAYKRALKKVLRGAR